MPQQTLIRLVLWPSSEAMVGGSGEQSAYPLSEGLDFEQPYRHTDVGV